MKRLLCGVLAAAAACTVFVNGSITASAEKLAPSSKAAYLCEFETGSEVYSNNETVRLPIASMCKIMTLLLSFEAINRGELTYDEMITVSENAQSMGGSQVYLQAGLDYSVDELLKTVAVCSANDSCVALAERVAGSESGFIDRMNERARELGAENTLFANCTGLPKEPQYSCAKDVAAMLRELLKHEKYYEYCSIWTEDFAHPDGRTTLITNTNKLVRSYSGCDGGKTGFTGEAGFCLAATAKRGDTRLISVVIGSPSSSERFKDITTMLDYAFGSFETKIYLDNASNLEEKVQVRGSKQKEIGVVPERPLTAFCKRGENKEYSVSITLNDTLRAPLKKGDDVGEAVLYLEGVEVMRTRLLASENADKFTWWDAYREAAQNWN